MRNGVLVLILLGSLESLACTRGGQSGTEERGAACGTLISRPVGLDENTPAGTARTLFDSVTSIESAALRWYSYYGTPSHSDTTLTLSVSGTPGMATYSWYSNCEMRSQLKVEGAILRFETADGAFDESILASCFAIRRAKAG